MSTISESQNPTSEATKVENLSSAETGATTEKTGASGPNVTAEASASGTDNSSYNAEDGLNSSNAPSVSVILSTPKTTEELIAARALKRSARKSAIREKAEGHKRAGDILFESKNYKASYPQYLEAIQLWGSNPAYFISLAGAYRKLQWYEEAAHAATRALTLDPKNSEARYVRGVARLEQRLLKPAKIDFETVLSHDPSHLLARAALTEVTAFITNSTQLGSHELAPSPVDAAVKDVDFGFPPYDYEAMELAELSDSSDCNHVGNGVQCRFYNHEGCARGDACTFSHAPDEKSVRDELGKNVCMYHLMDSCKFGSAKCIYSHSKAALPKRGWWTSPEQVAKVKSVLEVAEKQSREQRHAEAERWRAHVKAMKAAGRPPKSAGLKQTGKKGEKKENDDAEKTKAAEAGKNEVKVEEAVNGATEPPKSAGLGKSSTQKKKEVAKTNPPRRKTQSSAAKKKAAGTSTQTEATGAAKEAVPAAVLPASDKAAISGFTDYQLNAPLPNVKSEAPVALQY